MELSKDEEKEYSALWRKCGGTLVAKWRFKYKESRDIYVDTEDGHEWFHGEDVRRLRALAKRK